MAEVEAEKKGEEEEVKGGELLFCGSTAWDTVGRKKTGIEGNLYSPTRLRPLVGIDIRFVATGCVSCHCVALDVDGRCYTWGRNEACLSQLRMLAVSFTLIFMRGQLGHGDTLQRDRPTVVSELSKHKIVSAGAGRSHTVVVTEEGQSFSFGWNKHGQLGSGSLRNGSNYFVLNSCNSYSLICSAWWIAWCVHVHMLNKLSSIICHDCQLCFCFKLDFFNVHNTLRKSRESRRVEAAEPHRRWFPLDIFNFGQFEIESSPVRCQVSDVKAVACGGEFTVWLSSGQGSSILTAGLPQYGQLGHGTDNEYNSKDGSVRLAYEPQARPKAIASLSGETIVKVACGTNHTVAVDSNGYVYTWGFGGYGRLGHREQKDEWVPRRVDVFTRQNVLPPDAVVSAGAVNSACTAAGGQLYMWGKLKNTGDDWMYPKPLMDLSGWHLRCMDSGNMFHFVGADASCISWGHAQNGELGYGPNAQKSSAIPKKVEILEGMHVISVACGFAHSMVVVDRTNVEDRLEQLDVYDGKASGVEGTEVNEPVSSAKKTAKKKTAENSKKRKKKSKESSESEEEDQDEESDDEDNDVSEEEVANGKVGKRQREGKGGVRGRGRGGKSTPTPAEAKSRGRGRGRPKSSRGRSRK
ncbi:hypothetical protein Cgig2_005839 [Carnegiea gigantea]|uniref:Uncharacterized protein n=1 Tax=Carnegiea gigantea TaxID=171969 RepID=A0A9Q1QKS3_9CARY|nr:hypothetical protein Cgig2_005839 [Carnegiea gigantea]